jgi:hypothetical protein
LELPRYSIQLLWHRTSVGSTFFILPLYIPDVSQGVEPIIQYIHTYIERTKHQKHTWVPPWLEETLIMYVSKYDVITVHSSRPLLASYCSSSSPTTVYWYSALVVVLPNFHTVAGRYIYIYIYIMNVSGSCWSIFWVLLKYFGSCWSILRLVEVFWVLLKYFETCWSILRLVEVFWDLLKKTYHAPAPLLHLGT